MSVSVTGTISDVSYNARGLPKATITINEREKFLTAYNEIADAKLVIDIKKYRAKRSNDANSYCWVLCEKIAKKLAGEDVKQTKEEVYRAAIREIGIFKDFPNLLPDDAKTLRTAWEMLGTGWITEQVDFSQDGEAVTVRCYYGSSRYNTKQMSRLIDNLVEDCKVLGIPTETPEQIEQIKSLWEQIPKKG